MNISSGAILQSTKSRIMRKCVSQRRLIVEIPRRIKFLSGRKVLLTAIYPWRSFIAKFMANLFEFFDGADKSFEGTFKVFGEVEPVFGFDI